MVCDLNDGCKDSWSFPFNSYVLKSCSLTTLVGGLFPLIGVLWIGKFERLIITWCWGWVGPTDYDYFSRLIMLFGLSLALGPWLNSWGSWLSFWTKSSPQSFAMNKLDGHAINYFPILLPLVSHEKLHLLVHLIFSHALKHWCSFHLGKFRVQLQSNEPKKVLNYKEKQSKLDKYLCFSI